MPTTTHGIARALTEGPIELALERVFVGELGWRRCKGAIAEHGGLRLGTGEGCALLARGDGSAIEIEWRDGETTHVLPFSRVTPGSTSLLQLAHLRAGASVREGDGREPLRECFDPSAITAAFLSDYRFLFDKHRVGIRTVEGRSVSQEEADAFLNKFLLRAMLVAFLQSRGWLEFHGRKDYLQALYEDWSKNPGAHLFHQRLAPVFFGALDEPRPDARAMLAERIGHVPYIGGGLFSPGQFERESETERGFASLPEGLFEDLFGAGGMLSRYEFTMRESAPNVSIVAVTPEAMGAAMGGFLERSGAPVVENTAAHRRSCRRIVATQLGAPENFSLPDKWEVLEEWAEVLRGVNVFDGECGAGTYLVAALEELTDVCERVEQALGAKPDRSAIKRRVVKENVRGLDQREMAVQVARFRLMLAVLSSDEEPIAVPDMRPIVRRGGALPAVRSLPPEGPRVEYKASFEWDLRRGARSPDMRFGSLRTVAAFLNSEGGELYIGLADDGTPVGMADDFALIEDAAPRDVFEQRFREFMKNALDPMPLNNVRFSFREMEGKVVCVVEVEPGAGVTYLAHKDKGGQDVESVFVRDGNRTIELRGRARDAFVLSRGSARK